MTDIKDFNIELADLIMKYRDQPASRLTGVLFATMHWLSHGGDI